MKNLARLLITGILILVAWHTNAQTPRRGLPPPDGPAPINDSIQPQQPIDETPDTVGVFYFYADNPYREFPFADTTLRNFQQYDPVRQRDLDYANLGILGSAHRPLVFEPQWRRGFDVGLHQFDLYLTPVTMTPFYRIQKAFTNLSFMVGSEQADSYLTAQFSRNFAKGVNFSLDYKRISYIGQQNQFPNQNTRNTAVNVGLWIKGKSTRYQGFIAAAGNTVEQEDNGGVRVEPSTDGTFSGPPSAQVFMENAQSRYSFRELAYTHFYQLGGRPDSLKGFTRAYTVSHQFIIGDYTYKFFNDNVRADTAFFNLFPTFRADDRGIRHFIRYQKVENSFRLSTFKLRKGRENEPRSEQDLLEVGLLHNINILQQEPSDSTINNLFLTGKWNISLGQRLRLESYAHLGLLGAVGDYRVNGNLLIDLGKLGQLRAEFISQLYSPTLIQHRFYVSQRPLWNNDFSQTLSTTIGGTYTIPKLNVNITARYNLLNNFIYFDTTGIAQQTSTPISILQLIAQKDFRFWKFHLDNLIAIQQTSEDFIRLPQIFGKHSLYYAGKWFRVLDVRVGFDVRYNDAYYAEYYNPITGQFQLQNNRLVKFYPAVDGFFSMQITRFRGFVKWENLTSVFRPEDWGFFYQTPYYPNVDAAIRIGIKWRLVD
ncbi:MAG: putative porin [Saprospiraceae bacterium]